MATDRADYALDDDERRAIASLKRLAKRWPRSLTLASMGGSLYVLPTAHHDLPGGQGVDPDSVLAYLGSDIPNTGGDW